ncbi:hypothetical protein B2A_13077, partial [mine drainage metagenome]
MAFAPRTTARGHGHYPRYVEKRDEDILEVLLAEESEGPWPLRGPSGAQVLRLAVASGRAFWGSLRSAPLQAGPLRRARLGWRIGENGEQRLACDVGDAAWVMIDTEPPVYVDLATRACGTVELPCPGQLVRRYAD